MFKPALLLTFFISSLLLVGCGGGSVEVSATYSNDVDDPELRQVDIIDTYGTNSEFEGVSSLAISPYINNGEFEVFWDILSNDDYYVDVRINTVPALAGSQLIFSDYCDSDYSCYDHQYLYCQYHSDFDVVCENYLGDVQVDNITGMIDTIPQRLFLIVDTCDGYGENCTYQTIPVLFE